MISSEIASIAKIAKALSNPTRLEIIKLLQGNGEMNITEIAAALEQTEANASAQVRILFEIGLIGQRVEPGRHGLSKYCTLIDDKIVLELSSL